MFDDPKKSLRRLEEELWEAEYDEKLEELENDLEELPEEEETDKLLREAEELLEDVPESPRRQRRPRNDAVDFHRTVYADEEMDENSAVFVEKKKKKRGGRGWGCLPLILVLELAGIAGLVWWWIRWLG